MSDSLVSIGSFPNAIAAEQVRIVLAAEGIQAFVEGGNTNTMLSHVGSALGGVSLTVRESDAERALQLLQDSDFDDVSDAWHCRDCGEDIEAGFEVCWSCGKNRDEVGVDLASVTRVKAGKTEVTDDVPNDELEIDGDRASNPYSAPRYKTEGEEAPVDVASASDIDVSELEALVGRAWRASIIGLVFFPVLAHVYSLILLLTAATELPLLSEKTRSRFWGAVAIDMLVIFFALVVLRGFAR